MDYDNKERKINHFTQSKKEEEKLLTEEAD